MLYRFFDFHAGPNPSPKWEGGYIERYRLISSRKANTSPLVVFTVYEDRPPSPLGEGLGVGPTRSATTRSARKIFISLALFLLPLFLSAQDTKGAQPRAAPPPLEGAGGRLRAVVVGISDYQSPQIPDLRFAHRDAAAFADWLRSPAGGSVPEANLQVLLNADATTGKIIAALGGLVADCKPGDLAYIYFSGHGDVERISKFQRGYWLSWDSPPAVYAAGACALGYLQDIISTLSDMDVQVVVVADACRAGKLAGSAVGGAQATSAALAQQFANEIKILSCQPEEFSLEGEQWGGGRGAFSYHLLDGLYGIADQDEDEFVTLKELNRYLEDHVTPEAEPHRQNPMVLGNRAMRLVRVHPELLAQRRLQKSGDAVALQKIDSKGLEELALADADSSVQTLYREFVATLKRGDLMEARDGVSPTADTLYKQLIREPALADLHGLMTRNFAAALIDEGQQILNRLLSGDLQAHDVLENEIGINYRLLADQFHRATELLGEKHYYYRNLKSKALYFESHTVYDLDISPDSAEVLDFKLLRQALALDSTASLIWLTLCWMEPSPDSVYFYIQKLEELVPNWPIFHYLIGNVFSNGYIQKPDPEISLLHYQKAIECDSTFFPALFYRQKLLKELGQNEAAESARQTALRIGLKKMETAPHLISKVEMDVLVQGLLESEKTEDLNQMLKAYLNVDSNSFFRLKNYATYSNRTNQKNEAEWAYRKMLTLDSNNIEGLNLWGWALFNQNKIVEMEPVFRKAVALAPKKYVVWSGLGWSLLRQGKFEEAEQVFLKCLELDKKGVAAWNGLGQINITLKRYAEAEKAFRKYTEISPNIAYSWDQLGRALQKMKRYEEAESCFKKSTELDAEKFGAWSNLGFILLQMNRFAEADSALQRSISLLQRDISLNPRYAHTHTHLGMIYFKTNRLELARQNFLKALEVNPNYAGAMLGMAYILFSEGKTAEALAQVELAIGKNASFEQLENDRDLAPLRALPEWRALIKKHFPDQAKD